jgi:putative ABC transport system permease protein
VTFAVEHLWFGVGLVVLTGLSVGLAAWARVGLGFASATAIGRAVVQLTVVALLLRGILSVPWTVLAFIALMLGTASWTASGRLKGLRRGRRIAVVGVVVGATVSVVLIFALQMVTLEVRYVVAVAGILIGNAMSAATLSGRTFSRDSRVRRDEIEGWLALGATPSQAHDEIGRTAVRETMLPSIDQTRSTGLVTLPGAFVGALFGGASPAEAALFQLAVLAGIALTTTLTAVVVTRLAGSTPYVVVDA